MLKDETFRFRKLSIMFVPYEEEQWIDTVK